MANIKSQLKEYLLEFLTGVFTFHIGSQYYRCRYIHFFILLALPFLTPPFPLIKADANGIYFIDTTDVSCLIFCLNVKSSIFLLGHLTLNDDFLHDYHRYHFTKLSTYYSFSLNIKFIGRLGTILSNSFQVPTLKKIKKQSYSS